VPDAGHKEEGVCGRLLARYAPPSKTTTGSPGWTSAPGAWLELSFGQVRPDEPDAAETRVGQDDSVLVGDRRAAAEHDERGLHIGVRPIRQDKPG